jgi:hypothetical protein
MPEQLSLTTLIARDGEPEELRADTREAMSAKMRSIVCAGGTDNVSALEQAWTIAAARPGGVIVWVHERQPVLLKPVDELRRGWERRAGVAPLVMVATANVPNRIAEELDGVAEVSTRLRRGDLQTDLEAAFQELSGNRKPLQLVRERIAKTAFVPMQDDKETSSHLARLWAKDAVDSLLQTAGDDVARTKATDEATALAVRHQLVTPVTGAVVLETKEQYERAGLRPVAAGTVPTIPEPGTVLLMVVVALFLLWTLHRVRRERVSSNESPTHL